jgi:7-carboxy-7-deazaguanine synthase
VSENVLPIAEHFHSPQGEGLFTGTPMHFIRVAGCTVGRHPSNEDVKYEMNDTPFPFLKTGKPAWLCHTYDGRPFWCDTDFGLREKLTIDQLLDETWEQHICLTGGEPLAHDLHPFLQEALKRDIFVHIETSGTIMQLFEHDLTWITVSPKQDVLPDMIRTADEIKLLVDEHFSLLSIPIEVLNHRLVYVQPINNELTVDHKNVERCLKILRLKPNWRLSLQAHKLIGVR